VRGEDGGSKLETPVVRRGMLAHQPRAPSPAVDAST